MKEKSGVKTSIIVQNISGQISEDGINFKEFLDHIGDQGILLANVILVAPFLLPVSIPGSSTPLGLVILFLNLSNLLGGRSLLPDFILYYKISNKTLIKLLNGMNNILSGLERISKPRLSIMNDNSYIKKLNCCLIILSSFWLLLPLPVPLTDFLPAYCILFLTIGSLENDGYFILAGYILTTITTIYFILIAFLGIEIIIYILSQLGIKINISI